MKHQDIFLNNEDFCLSMIFKFTLVWIVSALLDRYLRSVKETKVVKDDAGAGLQHDGRQLPRLVLGRGPESRPLVVPRLRPWPRPLGVRGPPGGRGGGIRGPGDKLWPQDGRETDDWVTGQPI